MTESQIFEEWGKKEGLLVLPVGAPSAVVHCLKGITGRTEAGFPQRCTLK